MLCRLGICLLVPWAAEAAPPALRIDCPLLTPEQAAEVEARVLGGIIVSGLSIRRAEFECAPDRVTVSLRAQDRVVVHDADLDGSNLREQLMQAFEAALRRFSAGEVDPPEAPSSDPAELPRVDAPSVQPAPQKAPVLPSSPVPQRVPPRAPQSGPPGTPALFDGPRAAAEVSGGAALEVWRGDPAFGAQVEGAYGHPALSYTFQLGALAQLPTMRAFRALELSTGFGVNVQPSWSRGVRLHTSLGVSLLAVYPSAPYEPRGATTVFAAYGQVLLTRPLWFARWALVPAAGARFFAAERHVNLDDDAQLDIDHVTPRVAVSLLRRFD